MADQNLTSNITVGIVVDDKQVARELDKVAKMFGTTGEELTKKLNVDFIRTEDLDQLKEAKEVLWSMVNTLGGVKEGLKEIFAADPAALDRYIVKLREILVMEERGGSKLKGGSARQKTGDLKNIQNAISKEIFGEKGIKFNIGSFKGKLETRIKTWSEDFGDDAIDSIDLVAAGLEDVTTELNDYARSIAKALGIGFKNVDETAIDFLEASDPADAQTMIAALQKLKDGMKLSAKEILAMQNFNLNDDGKFTISPAMLIDAYEKAVLKYGADLFVDMPIKTRGSEKVVADLQTKLDKLTKEYEAMLAAMGTPFFKKDLFKKLEEEIKTTQDKISNALLPKGMKNFEKLDQFPEQASDNVISFLETELAKITKTPKGQSKLDQKIEDITFKIIQEILEKARAAGARALKNPKDFNRRMLNDYAPGADIVDIAGSEDTENLFRYAQEKAAKKAHELELKFGLAEGTVAAYLNVFSFIADADLDSLFSLADAANAVMNTSFTENSGGNVPSANARGFGRVMKPNGGLGIRFPDQMGLDIGSQILSNPAILEHLINTKPDALEKKVQALLVQRAKELGRALLPEETIEAIQLALVQSFVGQVRYAKVDQQDIVAEQEKLSKKLIAIYHAGQKAAENYAVALGERKAAIFAKMGSTELDAAQVNVNRAKAELDRLRNQYRYTLQDLGGVSPQKTIKEPLQTFPNVRTREDKAADKERGQALAVAIAKHEARLKDLEAAFAGMTRAQVIGPEETALNKTLGQALAVKIAKRRDRDRALVTPDLLDEAYADNTAFDFKKARAGRKSGLVSAMRKRIAAQVESVEQTIEEVAVEQVSSTQTPYRGNVIGLSRRIAENRNAAPAPALQAVAEQPMVEQAEKAQSWIQKLAEYVRSVKADFDAEGRVLMAALDTEFNPELNQVVSELSLNIRTASGQIVDLLTFIHIPFDKENLALEKSKSGAKNVETLVKRAKDMGLDMSKLGDIEDKDKNFEQLRAKVNALVSVLGMLDSLGVGLTGSNFKSAERANITKLIKYVNEESKARGLGTFQIPKSLDTPFDTVEQFKKAAQSKYATPEIKLVTNQGKTAGLTHLIKQIYELSHLWPGFVDQFKDLLVMTKEGPQVYSKTGELMPAHYAQADAVMSQIALAFLDRYGSSVNRTNQVVKGVKPSGSSPSGDGGGPTPPGGGSSSGPIRNQPPADLTGYFHTTREMEEQLASRRALTEDERFLVQSKLEILKKDGEQVAAAKQLVAIQTKIAELRTADAIRTRAVLGGDFSPSEKAQSRAGFIGPLEDKPGLRAVRDYNDLRQQEMEVTKLGRKREAQTINETLELGRYKDMQEQVRLNTRKQIDEENERAKAGKQFSAQIKQNLKEEVEASKAVQKANREQINQWVTARYALYDVGNFYQNLSQQLFGFTRQILNTTEAYKKFESSFTSVERAMQLTEDASNDMRRQFVSLSEVLPVTFEDLAKIATLGAQMGISAGGIKQFTETVAEFSAITGISADTVAQKFGRIAELANIDSSQFSNLGSAVAYAGINAVATESEILTLTESIAAASEQSGFMPEEIIGMSTALASVGIQAEQARGVFTRVFADIDRAVSRGGSELDNFAKASGMSAEDFSAQWGTEGQTYNVFRRLLGGLAGGGDLTKTFDSLNIVETREVNTLTRLANNLNVVDRAVSDANDSYAEGIFLSQSFAKTSDNLDAQLVIFRNNLDSFSASFSKGFGAGLKETLKTGSEFLKFLKGASENDVAQGLLPAVAGLTAVGGSAALATAGFSKLIAQIYAFRVAQINGMNASGTDIIKLGDRVKQLTGAYSDLVEVRGGLRGVGTVEDKGVVTPVTYNAMPQIRAQKDALIELAKTRDIDSARNIMNLAKQNDLLKSSNILLITASSSSKEAIQDARAQADAIQRIIEGQKMQNAAMAQRFSLDDMGKAKLANRKFFVEIVNGEAVAISRGTVAEIDNQIASARAAGIKNVEAEARRRNIRALNEETVTATTAATSFGSKVLNGFTKALGAVAIIATVVSAVGMLITAIDEANKIKLLDSGGGLQSLRDALSEDTKVWQKTGEAATTVQIKYTDFAKATYPAYDAIVKVTGANKNLKAVTGEVTESVKTQTVAIGQNTKEWLLNSIIANDKVNGWLKENPGLFTEAESALKSYGLSFSSLIQDILKNPQGGGEATAIRRIDTAMDAIQAKFDALGGRQFEGNVIFDDPETRKKADALIKQMAALAKIKQILKEIGIAMAAGLDTSALRASLATALGSVEDLDTGVQDLTKNVKTLTQWAGEVGQVMQAAFDIRYGKITALDNIRKAWSDLRKKADDARKAVKKAQDQLNALKANRTVLEYQFSIAIKYGDSKRAAELQAKLDENTNSTTDAADQLAEAQKALSTDLRSGSDAAIENRSTLSGLVQTYIPYIQALLNSGKNQKDVAKEVDKLKKEFRDQATEIGFADADLVGYVKTFDLYKDVVTDMPKTVTVNIKGLDEAARAMKEFASAVNGMKKDPIISDAALAALNKAAERTEAISKYRNLAVESSLLEKRIGAGALSTRAVDQLFTQLSGIKAQMKDLDKKYSLVNPYSGQMNAYATGGYVSGAGTGTSDSIPARLSNGEFVMSAKAVANYGVDFMNSLNQSRVMYAPAQPSAGQAGGGSSVVYLSPDDRALLRAAIDRPVNLYADSTRLAQSVNNGNKVLAQRGSI